MRRGRLARCALMLTLCGAMLASAGCADRRYAREARATGAVPVAIPVAPAPAPTPVQPQPAPQAVVQPQPLPQVVVQPRPVPTQVAPGGTPANAGAAAPGPTVRFEPLPAGTTPANVPARRVVVATDGLGPAALNDGRPVIDVDTIPEDVPQKLEQYRLGPGDRLQIKVFGQEDISGEFEISAAGELSVPLIGQITAENLTLGELAQVITTALNTDYIVDPKVSIEVTNYRPFFILGQVGKPGSYKYQPGLNTRMAVAVGGGYTRRAREEPITVYRVNASGELVRFRVDQNAIVLPGDTIEVHRRLF